MSENEKENLVLWKKVSKTDPKYVKEAEIGGRRIKTIDAYYRTLVATEHFGSYGSKWGLKNQEINTFEISTTMIATIKCKFFYPGGEFEINNSIKVSYMTQGYKGKEGYLKIDDDFMKKLETDTLTKALSKLGFSADVFMGMFEDNRYVEERKQEEAQAKDDEIEKITADQKNELEILINDVKADLPKMLSFFNIDSLEKLPLEKFGRAEKILNSKKDKS